MCWKGGQAGSAVKANLAGGPSLEGILGPALPSTREQGQGRLDKVWPHRMLAAQECSPQS